MQNPISKIRWELTRKCNLNCSHCFIGNRFDDFQDIDLKNALLILDKLCLAGVKNISFTTKEPLLYDNIYELMKQCSKKGININLITNGTLLSRLEVVKKIIDCGVKLVSISLEGISADTNDKIRGEGVLNKVLTGIENLDKVQNNSLSVVLGIQMSLNSLNYSEAEKIPTFFNKIPINFLYIGDISVEGNADNNAWLKLDNKKYSSAYIKIIDNYNFLHKKNYYLVSKSLLPWEIVYYNIVHNTDYSVIPPYCGILNNDFSLMPDGTLFPCVSLYKNTAFPGVPRINLISNDINQNSDKGIYNYRHHLISFIDREKNKANCNSCYYFVKCYPCPATLTKKYFHSEIKIRCQDSFVKIGNYFDRLRKDNCCLALRDGVFLSYNGNTIKTKRSFPNGVTSENYYLVNYKSRNEFEKILKGPLRINNVQNEETWDLLKKLVYDNFVKIYIGGEKYEYRG